MKLIVAGGRNVRLNHADFKRLDALVREHGVTEIVVGRATGVDTDAENWAKMRGLPVSPFHADWDNLHVAGAIVRRRKDGSHYNAAAGPQRNTRMAEYADALAVFNGGEGTADMAAQARARGLRIFDFRTPGATPQTLELGL